MIYIKKIKSDEIGDVFAIKTDIGYGIFQVVSYTNDVGISVIRVLSKIIQNLSDFSQGFLNDKERYFVKFPVKAALNKRLIISLGNYDVPSCVKVPKKYRMLDYVPHRNIRNWYIVDAKTNSLKLVSKINDKLLSLSCDCIWNDTLLKERLEENWSLKNWI